MRPLYEVSRHYKTSRSGPVSGFSGNQAPVRAANRLYMQAIGDGGVVVLGADAAISMPFDAKACIVVG